MEHIVITVPEDEVASVYAMYDEVQDATSVEDYNNGYRTYYVAKR